MFKLDEKSVNIDKVGSSPPLCSFMGQSIAILILGLLISLPLFPPDSRNTP